MGYVDVEVGEPGPGEARVRHVACGLNYIDVYFRTGAYPQPLPAGLGMEGAGVVEAVGAGVTHVKPGDRVLGNTGWGGMAEELALEAGRLVKIPDAMPFDEAAAFIMTYGTSWHALEARANLQAGQTLLVLGAAGGVGLAAVELGAAMGARVIAACSSGKRSETNGLILPCS